jgi:stage V sporulation protein SpoVS
MSINAPTLYTQQFASNVALLSQQKISKLTPCVATGSHTGKQASPVNQVGSIEMQAVNSRFAPKKRTDLAVDRRWVAPEAWDLQQLVDTFDQMKAAVDLKSGEVAAAVAARNRRKDYTIINSFFAAALTGEVGGTSTAFPTSTTSNVVSVSYGATTSNMSVAKLKKAVELLLTNNVDLDEEEVFCGLSPKANTALLNDIEVIDGSFKGATVDSKGRLMAWNGIQFKHSNYFANGTDDAAGTSRALPLWCKSGMYLGVWQDDVTRIRQAEELQGNPWELYCYQSFGATRLEEAKVIKIWAREP